MSSTQNNVNNTNLMTKYRQDFAIIAGWVSFGTKVLDLGCGDGELLARLQRDREVPWKRRELAKLLDSDFEGSWSITGARPPGLDADQLLDNLVELGVLRARANDLFDVPDLYLQGFDLRRKGGVAKK